MKRPERKVNGRRKIVNVYLNELETYIDYLEKQNTKKDIELSYTSHKPFVDEYGNADWRDTGEMGG
jgi:hypothetical protein